jgi:hypothetical protein
MKLLWARVETVTLKQILSRAHGNFEDQSKVLESSTNY